MPLKRSNRRGFTLVELLIVIGIITVLTVMIVPAISKVRRQAKITACASNIHQFVVAMDNYAANNDRQYPTMGTTSNTSLADLCQVSQAFYTGLINQGLTYNSFFCPVAQDRPSLDAAYNAGFTKANPYFTINYSIWMPRLDGKDVIPPAPSYKGGRFKIVGLYPTPTTPFAGPASPSDPEAVVNPLVTDVAISTGATPTYFANAALTKNPWGFKNSSNHRDGIEMVSVNWGFADGHVETHPVSTLHPYYRGSSDWNWR